MRRGRGKPQGSQSNATLMRLGFLLFQQVRQMERKPPVTIALVLMQVLIFIRPEGFDFIPSIQDACLQPYLVFKQLDISRLLWSAFLHADELHIFYNMSSFLWKGAQLEPAMGPGPYIALIATLTVTSHLLVVLLSFLGASFIPLLAGGFYSGCSVGFSAVIFALKVVLSVNSPGTQRIAGVAVPTKYGAWAELVLIQLVTPNASFVGHLAGILAGLLYVAVRGAPPALPDIEPHGAAQPGSRQDPFSDPLFGGDRGRNRNRRGGGGSWWGTLWNLFSNQAFSGQPNFAASSMGVRDDLTQAAANPQDPLTDSRSHMNPSDHFDPSGATPTDTASVVPTGYHGLRPLPSNLTAQPQTSSSDSVHHRQQQHHQQQNDDPAPSAPPSRSAGGGSNQRQNASSGSLQQRSSRRGSAAANGVNPRASPATLAARLAALPRTSPHSSNPRDASADAPRDRHPPPHAPMSRISGFNISLAAGSQPGQPQLHAQNGSRDLGGSRENRGAAVAASHDSWAGVLQYRWDQAKQWGAQHSASLNLELNPVSASGSQLASDHVATTGIHGSHQHILGVARSSPRASRISRRRSAYAAAVLAALSSAYYTRPDGPHFAAFVAKYLKRFAGPAAGRALATIPWLQTRFGLGFEIWNCYFFSIARYHAFWFLGAYSRWVPMPNPVRLVPGWGYRPLSAFSKLSGAIASWLHALGGAASQLAFSLQQSMSSGPAFIAGLSSLLQVLRASVVYYLILGPHLQLLLIAAIVAVSLCKTQRLLPAGVRFQYLEWRGLELQDTRRLVQSLAALGLSVCAEDGLPGLISTIAVLLSMRPAFESQLAAPLVAAYLTGGGLCNLLASYMDPTRMGSLNAGSKGTLPGLLASLAFCCISLPPLAFLTLPAGPFQPTAKLHAQGLLLLLLAKEAVQATKFHSSRRMWLVWSAAILYGAVFACLLQPHTGLPVGPGKLWWSL
ncbi:hypothetical protein WJX74_010895 [Apatococcus lobatus]|uniref:Peptidase S54 rhomboid domain-containing protein n=1 Tax=Apatococcus lobatus TaxID=904363 RepID=A0AAW1QDS8_9CHLO